MFRAADVKWDEQADVVVVGYGGAGGAAAISAHEAGAKVIVMEKQEADTPSRTNHTPSTRMSGGGWFCPDNEERAKLYVEGMAKIANEALDKERKAIISALAHAISISTDWMVSHGAILGERESFSPTLKTSGTAKDMAYAKNKAWVSEWPDLPGSDNAFLYFVKAAGGFRQGAAFFKVLSDAITKSKIDVMWGTPGEHLVVDGDTVCGVIGTRNGKPAAVRARRGVILASGGFEFSPWLKENYLRVNPTHFYGNPGNTGDGINMALEVGAALWHMNAMAARVTMKFPDHPVAFGTQHHEEKGIIVDRRGKRFTNERFKMHAFAYELTNYDCYAMTYPRVPSYWIFDEKRRKEGAIASYQGVCNPPGGVAGAIHYIWSEDNKTEIAKGWIMKASSIEKLADMIAKDADNGSLMTPAALRETVRRYNGFARQKNDLDFGRPDWSLAPLEDPPYYAVKLWPGGPNTFGGPWRSPKGQVLQPDGTPVAHLYSAGELGSWWSMFYNAGGNVSECIGGGKLAGENAASEKPLK